MLCPQISAQKSAVALIGQSITVFPVSAQKSAVAPIGQSIAVLPGYYRPTRRSLALVTPTLWLPYAEFNSHQRPLIASKRVIVAKKCTPAMFRVLLDRFFSFWTDATTGVHPKIDPDLSILEPNTKRNLR